MKRNLVEISGNVYAAWSKPGEGGIGWYRKGDPQCSKIKDATENKMWITLKYGEKIVNVGGKEYKCPLRPNIQFYVIKENNKYYIDTNSASFNNLNEDQKKELLKYLKSKI